MMTERHRFRRCCCWCCVAVTVLLFLLALIILILVFTVFKPKDPTTTVVSTAVDGITPRIIFYPTPRIEINITLSMSLLVYNPNRLMITHRNGSTLLFFQDQQVGEAVVLPGRVPAKGLETIYVKVTVRADRLASNLQPVIAEVLAGELHLSSRSTIPGRVTFLRIIHHDVVASVQCQTAIRVTDLKVRSQNCSYQTKL